ncbi:NAD(P)-binding protein [Daedalea quercina L-15889]|uniref:NAD(P)-binding protein n=1 Tax=Daedalea quercina L-15889 TaxID=1314783 RepID=A0A165U725_9APHY|nr:NAD(P)-binding protein [Daedalea quercina L-15889]
MSTRVWFITGSSTGFGRATTEQVLQKGDIVVATLRKPEVLADLTKQYGPDKLLTLKLDVTKPQEIKDAFAAAVARFGRVDVVFNNAGYGMQGEVEGTPEDVARANFEVNFWGAANVTKEAVRVFREENRPAGGRLLQMSSIAGITCAATVGYYGAAKHALNGVTEALAAEVSPEWNIKITLIEPSFFRTEAISNAVYLPMHLAYAGSPSAAFRSSMNEDYVKTAPDASELAERVYRLSLLAEPPFHLVLGKTGLGLAKGALESALADVNKFADWSDPFSM